MGWQGIEWVIPVYTIIEADRTRTIYNWLQYFSPEAIAEEFVKCGFGIETLYADVAGTLYNSQAGEFEVAARKP